MLTSYNEILWGRTIANWAKSLDQPWIWSSFSSFCFSFCFISHPSWSQPETTLDPDFLFSLCFVSRPPELPWTWTNMYWITTINHLCHRCYHHYYHYKSNQKPKSIQITVHHYCTIYSSNHLIHILKRAQWIFPQFCFSSKHSAFIAWVLKLIFRRSQMMIWHHKWSNMAKKEKKKISFDAKSSIGPCKISLRRLM